LPLADSLAGQEYENSSQESPQELPIEPQPPVE
jgi:hypothetical protein